MNKPNLGLSIFIGALFSTFITSIYILMRTVPALLGQGDDAGGALGDAIVVWLVMTGLFSYGLHEWQKFLEEFNKRNRRDDEDKRGPDNQPPM
jgi:hypothetical protein